VEARIRIGLVRQLTFWTDYFLAQAKKEGEVKVFIVKVKTYILLESQHLNV